MRSLRKQLILLFTGLIGFMLYGGSVLAAPTAEMLSSNCNGCHGPNGVTNGPSTPSIAGMTEEYLVLSMMDYKKATRGSTIMSRIAKGYSDDEIKAMAKYFSGKKYASYSQKTNKDQVKKGAKLQKKYCKSCHEKKGLLADGIGILAGQPVPYLEYTMADFYSGNRPMERRKKQKMDQLIKDAGKDSVHSLVQFYASQK